MWNITHVACLQMGKSKRRLLLKKRKRKRSPDVTKRALSHSESSLYTRHKTFKKKKKKAQKTKCEFPEDKEIHELERLLGMKSRDGGKLSSEFTRDGLDYLLNFSSSRNESDDDVEEVSRRDSSSELKLLSHDDTGVCTRRGKRVRFSLPLSVSEEAEGCEEEEVDLDGGTADTERGEDRQSTYMPPQKRKIDRTDLARLRRKIQGLVNRLSESNISGIVSQLERLYSENSRNDVNSVFTDVMLKAAVQPILLSNKMAMEHMMVVALLHCNVGTEVGAFFVEQLVKMFDQLYQSTRASGCGGKECDCTLLLLAQLYNFKVVHCVLIYDIIRKLIESFTETDIELLLLVLKESGMEIRKDDPGSLKEIIKQIQSKASEEATSQSSRIKFMLEIIAVIRTNNSHKIPNYDPELKLHMKKLMRGLGRSPGTIMNEVNQLKIPLKDLLEADMRGRWWVVGSSWSGREDKATPTTTASDSAHSNEILVIAREQRMNTDVRKNIFCLMMTSEDYIDAFTKLIGLHLKSAQEREIVHVLMDCCLQEKSFNLYYVYLGQKLCEYHRNHQVTFQYAIWDKLKTLDILTKTQLANLCQFLIHMIYNGALSVAVLRVVEFSELSRSGVTFYKSLFRNLLLKMTVEKSRAVFSRGHHSKTLLNNLCIFIRQYLGENQFEAHFQVIEQCLKDRKSL